MLKLIKWTTEKLVTFFVRSIEFAIISCGLAFAASLILHKNFSQMAILVFAGLMGILFSIQAIKIIKLSWFND